jgi:hypothetical protein
VPILNPVVDMLSRAEGMTCSEMIVPREDGAATLDWLDPFIADPQRLKMFRNRQFLRHAALFEARPLRQWLRQGGSAASEVLASTRVYSFATP